MSGRSYLRGPRSRPLLNAMGESAKFLADTARRFVADKANANDVEAAIAEWRSARGAPVATATHPCHCDALRARAEEALESAALLAPCDTVPVEELRRAVERVAAAARAALTPKSEAL